MPFSGRLIESADLLTNPFSRTMVTFTRRHRATLQRRSATTERSIGRELPRLRGRISRDCRRRRGRRAALVRSRWPTRRVPSRRPPGNCLTPQPYARGQRLRPEAGECRSTTIAPAHRLATSRSPCGWAAIPITIGIGSSIRTSADGSRNGEDRLARFDPRRTRRPCTEGTLASITLAIYRRNDASSAITTPSHSC